MTTRVLGRVQGCARPDKKTAPNPRCFSENARRLVCTLGPLYLAAALGRTRPTWRDLLIEDGTPYPGTLYIETFALSSVLAASRCSCRTPCGIRYAVESSSMLESMHWRQVDHGPGSSWLPGRRRFGVDQAWARLEEKYRFWAGECPSRPASGESSQGSGPCGQPRRASQADDSPIPGRICWYVTQAGTPPPSRKKRSVG